MKTKLRRFPIRELPASFQADVRERLSHYTVAIARLTSDDVATLKVVGSGTLVVRDGQHGILTAHHCLHALPRAIKLGNVGPDRIYVVTKRGYIPFAAQHELSERTLGVPVSEHEGPDLTFIKIPAGPMLSELKRIASFAR